MRMCVKEINEVSSKASASACDNNFMCAWNVIREAPQRHLVWNICIVNWQLYGKRLASRARVLSSSIETLLLVKPFVAKRRRKYK
jgi:plasmid replication initiation protein